MKTSKLSPRFPTFRYLFSWRFLRVFLFVVICIATVLGLFYTEENVRGKRAWDAYVRERTAKGEKVYFREFIPPPVPDEQNLALCPLLKPILDLDFRAVTNGRSIRLVRGPNFWRDTNGVNRLQRLSRSWGIREYYRMHPLAPRRRLAQTRDAVLPGYQVLLNRLENHAKLTNGWIDLGGWATLYRTGTNLPSSDTTNTPAAEVLLALRSLEPDLAELHQEAARRPLGRWPIYYNTNEPAGILLPHLAPGKSITSLLQLRAAAYFNLGKTEAGLSDVELGLQLAESFREEPFLISQLVRNVCQSLLLQPLKEGLARHQL